MKRRNWPCFQADPGTTPACLRGSRVFIRQSGERRASWAHSHFGLSGTTAPGPQALSTEEPVVPTSDPAIPDLVCDPPPCLLTRPQGPEQGRTWARCRGSRGGDLRVTGNRQSYTPVHTRPLSINPWRGHVGFSEAARPASDCTVAD